jgi:DNA ligase D-like protein (predicted 3'-phosphoesterase)
MATQDKLKAYKDKRDFKKTSEPEAERKSGYKHMFVIQKHDASRLHYDFRIEVDGVLVSWAVPKGPSTDTREKRLAIRTEDHPVEYADFEGVIPEGQYGAGTVMVWDRGKYRNMRSEENGKSLANSLNGGKIEIWLNGKKIKGGYSLIKTGSKKEKERWLMIKHDDKHADARRNPVSSQPKSVKSGKTLHKIKKTDDKISG